VVRVESIGQDLTTSHWTSLAGGCDLGIPYERYLWRVHVRGGDPGVECLCGMKPQDGGAVEAWGIGYPYREHILSGPPNNWYVKRTGS
jgi:hypothetical protein